MGSGGEIRLKPSQIRFSQNSVFYKFYKRSKTLNEEVNTFITSCISSVDQFPVMETIIKDRKIYSLDNRRLYVFRVLERRGRVTDVPVIIRAYSSGDSRKFTTRNDGETIVFTGKRRRSISNPSPVEHGSSQGTSRNIEVMDMNLSTKDKVSSILKEIEEEEERERKAQEMRKQEEDDKTTPVESDEELIASESNGYESIVLVATMEEVLVKEAEEDTVEFPPESVLESVEIQEKDEAIISAITDEDSLVLEPSEEEPPTVEPIKRFSQEHEENNTGVVWSFANGLFQSKDACLEEVDRCQETKVDLVIASDTEPLKDSPTSEAYKSSVANAAEPYQSSSELEPMRILQNTTPEEPSNQLKRSHDSMADPDTVDDEESDAKILRLSNEIETETLLIPIRASEPYSDLSEASSEKIMQKRELEEHVNPLKRTHDDAIESKTDEVEGIGQELLLSENKVIEENGSGQENDFTDGEIQDAISF